MFMNKLKTFIFLVALSGLLLMFGGFLGGYNGIKIALIVSLLINFVTYFFSDKIVLAIYGAQELDETYYGWIYSIVNELTEKMNIPMPKLWLIDSNMANAFATGRNPSHASVALTSGIINILDKNELRGVIAHELSHIKNRDILIATIAATVATAISYMASMLRYAAFWGSFGGNNKKNGNPIALIIMSIIMPIAAIIMQLAISRSREYLADETGAIHSQDPLALASALEKLHSRAQHTATNEHSSAKESTASLFIVNPFSGKNIINIFSTHPPVDERIKKLQKIYEKMHNIN
ncbi:MAG: Protease HtpX-like protein [candidate division TM6 bacterium GW2011_GWF2_30_66]|nr:MAG: Protease HtpX-like protein [candidate division TM6 bacterium GW2011_GWF2_30_66]